MNQLAVGIVYVEKAQLDYLAAQVAEAQYEVNQQQANVDALAAKAAQFSGFLAEADANRKSALANLNLGIDIDASVKSLYGSTALSKAQTDKACGAIEGVSADMATLIDKLIFSVEIIDKFGQLVNKQKLSNPLIPDTLISCIAKGNADANNAIALTLTALQSCYAAEATSLRSKQIVGLTFSQVTALQEKVEREIRKISSSDAKSGASVDGEYVVGLGENSTGVLPLLEQTFANSNRAYELALADTNMVNGQLAHAKKLLETATTSLNSYTAGLAAATAAAYAA